MMKYFKIILILSFIISVASCDEGNDIIFVPDAKLIWTGDYDLDGCGFFVKTHGNVYKPENEGIIPPEYRVDSLSITVQFIDLLYKVDYNCNGIGIDGGKSAKAIKLLYMDPNEILPD